MSLSSTDNTRSRQTFADALSQRVLVLDGSMGVQIQRLGLSEADFRGDRFAAHPSPLKGNNDILVLTRPDLIAGIHRAYLEAGADIIETDSFNSNALSQHEYGTESLVDELNFASARIARGEADRYMAENPARTVFVAGSIGPTAVSASLSSDVSDPALRAVDFGTLYDAFYSQAAALIRGGVDMLLVETIFDMLNAKAAAIAARDAMEAAGHSLPLIFSFTLSDASGRILSGHSIEAFLTSIAFARPDAVGLNCSAGPDGLMPALKRLSEISPYPTIIYPNAGLPDECGCYSSTPAEFAAVISHMLDSRLVNIVGGCCGTGPDHIALIRREVDARPDCRRDFFLPFSAGSQPAAEPPKLPWLAGIDAFCDDRGFINIGERCNVAGSRRFLRLVSEGNWDEACAIAVRQVEDGAMILDINMDDALLDTPALIVRFLRLLGADPVTASVPWMIDSSDFRVIEAALKNIPGKAIVNSISLKKGEESFLRQASLIRRFGAAVVVMAFDERGQADTFERKIEICARAYRLLVDKAGFDPRDIVFDPNILTIATGMSEHDGYADAFIRAVRWISENLPGAKTSGGVSNLSFAFRGNNYIRQALHAVFLYNAVEAGLSMAIMDPSAKVSYSDIPDDLLAVMTDAVFNRADGASRLIAAASGFAGTSAAGPETAEVSRPADISQRLALALLRGDDSYLEADLAEALGSYDSAVTIIQGPLMAGMEEVGRLFSEGKLFLPQVVKSARIMHKAVAFLRPSLESASSASASSAKARFVVATVKGDVHDIGKNIVSVVLRCNNFEVIDLGVQVDAAAIVDAALRLHPDFIGLSGLITPSLEEMRLTVRALAEAGITVPVFVGGAATSDVHTAVRIAPEYPGLVIRVSDAAANPVIATRLLTDPDAEARVIRARQQEIRRNHDKTAASSAQNALSSLSSRPLSVDWDSRRAAGEIVAPTFTGQRVLSDIPVATVSQFINWTYFFNCWRVMPSSPRADELRADAERLIDRLAADGAAMQACVAFYPAASDGSAISVAVTGSSTVVIPVPRQKPSPSRELCLSIADFLAPADDWIGAFIVTIGERLRQALEAASASGDDYDLILLQSVCDRLAEAASEYLHYLVRTDLWGYASDERLDFDRIRRARYRGIRPAVGYPSLPDQRLMFSLARLVDPASVGVSVTENGALSPASSVAGFYLASPVSRYFTIS